MLPKTLYSCCQIFCILICQKLCIPNYRLQISQGDPAAIISIPRNRCDIEYDISVEAVSNCGTSAQSHGIAYVPPCGGYYVLSPNPASSELTVSTDQTKPKAERKTFSEIRIYDLEGNLKKIVKCNKSLVSKINISNLNNGSYTIEIREGDFSERKVLIIQK